MWILESNSDLFQGRRMWLKPGKKYLFGRVKKDGVRYVLDHKTISRKHFTISIDEVKPGDSARIHARTRITITDLDSKRGTDINGSLLQNGTKDLSTSSDEHFIRPGNFPNELVIRWIPCTITFQLTKKELNTGTLKSKSERLEALDVKVSADYINGATTHVVAAKRNTVRGLQALIQGKYLVSDSFVDALVYAATPENLDEDENLSHLEQDFDASWPSAKEHLVAKGKEPTERPDSTYEPDLNRANVFEDFVFIFLDRGQYDNLLPVITTGQGKALFFEVKYGGTRVAELVKYMQNAAGKKGFGDTQEGSPKGGALLVRSDGHKDFQDWTTKLIADVSIELHQRAIDQAEFLDAILATDASLLRCSESRQASGQSDQHAHIRSLDSSTSVQPSKKRPLPAEHAETPSRLSTIQVQSSYLAPEEPVLPSPSAGGGTQRVPSSAIEPTERSQVTVTQEPPRKKPRLRHVPRRRFKNFDDEFDEDAIAAYSQDDLPNDSLPQSASVPASREQSVDSLVKEEPMSTRKHRQSPQSTSRHNAGGDNSFVDDLFPAAAAMQRQRTDQPDAKVSTNTITASKRRKKETEIDVRGAARAQREAEEEAARKEREAVAASRAHEDHTGQPANLAIIELMPLRPRAADSVTRKSANSDHRWDPAWNGRKNFKRFCRSGGDSSTEPRRRPQKVIVALVETKTNNFGFGDWDSVSKPKKHTTKSQSKTQSQSQLEPNTQSTIQTASIQEDVIEVISDEDEAVQQTSPQLSRLQAEAESIMDHAIDPESPRRTRLADKAQLANARFSQKRPASKSTSSAGREKRQKTIPTTRDHGGGDDSDSDDMKFKFGRRKK